MVIPDPDTDDSQAFTDDDSGSEEEKQTPSGRGDAQESVEESAAQTIQKKTVAQIMRDKKKQTQLTLQWQVFIY